MRIDKPAQMQVDPKRMPVQARALVPGRHVGKSVRGLESERAENLHKSGLRAQAARRRRELEAQLHVPHVQRIELHSVQTVKSTEPKWRRHCSQ